MKPAPFHIGIDLDNTLIDYDRVFGQVAVEIGLVPKGTALSSKAATKSYLTETAQGEEGWMRLQGQVYGRFIKRAQLFAGAGDCLLRARSTGCTISIVSHKTKRGHFDEHKINLWDAARDWLEDHQFFDLDGYGLRLADVHFEETRDAKIDRIRSLGCQVFVDDLPEILLHRDFPSGAKPIWFANSRSGPVSTPLVAHNSWQDIEATLFGSVH